jgi:hypothetical protein
MRGATPRTFPVDGNSLHRDWRDQSHSRHAKVGEEKQVLLSHTPSLLGAIAEPVCYDLSERTVRLLRAAARCAEESIETRKNRGSAVHQAIWEPDV